MKWGLRWGNAWGKSLVVENVKMIDLQDIPPAALIKWDANTFYTNPHYHLIVDGKFYQTTTGLELVVQFKTVGRHFAEVFISTGQNQNEDYGICFTTIPGGRVLLTWTASASPDLNHYDIYWDLGLGGGPSTLLNSVAEPAIQFITDELDDGTYEFRVDPCDNAGNCLTSGSTVSVDIDKFPNAPTNLSIDTYTEATDDADFSFTISTTPSVTNHRVYTNGGSGAIDYTSIVATIASPTAVFTLNLPLSGKYLVGIRAFNGTLEEDNVDVVVAFELGGGPVDLLDPQPNTPTSFVVIPAAAATFNFFTNYEPFEELGVATVINFYRNDGLGGAVDFSTIIATGTVPVHSVNSFAVFRIEATSPGLVDTNTYIFACKSATAAARESEASLESSAVADATAPSDIAGLTGTAVNFEQ